ncbi:MAG TPA: hypothetical protein VFM69_13380 [Pricia sp.]|nr:hypothetical protein [Pricia sp.]
MNIDFELNEPSYPIIGVHNGRWEFKGKTYAEMTDSEKKELADHIKNNLI